MPQRWYYRSEELHPNTVMLSGRVTRVWRQDDDVVVRLASYSHGLKHHTSLLLPGGKPMNGRPISLMSGMRLMARGFLRSVERIESYADLLKRIGHPHRIEAGDETLNVARTVTYVVVDGLEPLIDGDGGADDANEVEVQGIVWKTWKLPRRDDAFARLALYDSRAPLTFDGQGGSRREANYVSIMFARGLTAEGFPVQLLPHKQARCSYRIEGYLHNTDYFERLPKILRRLKRADRVREGDEEVKVGRTTTYVMGQLLHEYRRPARVENGRSKN
jgi:hypothetical protein